MILPIVIVIAVVAGLAAAGASMVLCGRRGAGRRSRSGAWRLLAPGLAFGVTALVVGGLLLAFSRGDDRPERRLLDAINRHHPESAAEIQAIRTERDPQLAQSKAADLAQRYFPRHLPTTSDTAVLLFTAEMTRVFEGLQARDPLTCKALASGGNVSASLDPQSMRPTLNAMADVIEDSVSRPQPPPDQQRAQALLGGIVSRVYAKPDDSLVPPQMLAQPSLVPADKLCRTMIAFYREILALPPQDGSTVIRVLMRAQKR